MKLLVFTALLLSLAALALAYQAYGRTRPGPAKEDLLSAFRSVGLG